MIMVFITAEHTYTWPRFLATSGQVLASQVQLIPYGSKVDVMKLPSGVAIFTDIDRLLLFQKAAAARVHQRITRERPDIRVLNSPSGSLLRYELLNLLFERGINRFAVYRADGPWTSARYPVFVRVANDHNAPRTSLLSSAAEVEPEIQRLLGLQRWKKGGAGASKPKGGLGHAEVTPVWRDRSLTGFISRLRRRIHRRRDIIVSEFSATADSVGLYNKYGAFVVGRHIVPAHLWFSRHWVVKFSSSEQEQVHLNRELDYLCQNPHAEKLREICSLAQIQYGRIDYSMDQDGNLQVWEINTNPVILPTISDPGLAAKRERSDRLFAAGFIAALRDLNAVAEEMTLDGAAAAGGA